MAMTHMDLKPGPFEETAIKGGLPKLVRIWEYLREKNTGGYGGGVLVAMKNGINGGSKVTSCSPFTATVIYMALDPREVDTSKPYSLEAPYDPRFDGGKLLSHYFYSLHNGYSLPEYKLNGTWRADFKKDYLDKIPDLEKLWPLINHSAGSVVTHNLGTPFEWKKMRRGDMVGIDWMSGHGHAVFCWNVHLDANGDVDCFQFVSSNGSGAGGPGITVMQYPTDSRYLKGSAGSFAKVKDMFSGIVDDPKAYPEYVCSPYQWYGCPKILKKDIDLNSFGVPAKHVTIVDYTFQWQGMKLGVQNLAVSRLHGVTPPDPWLRADGKTPSETPEEKPLPPPVAKATAKPVDAPKQETKAQEKKKDEEPEKKEPEKVKGDVQPHQIETERWLQQLWQALWIDCDPGEPDEVNDPASQEAVKDFQSKWMKGSKVPHPGYADPTTRAKLERFAAWALATPMINASLQTLFDRGVLKSAPGSDPAHYDEASREAVKEFQKANKLDADGIPGNKTQEKLAAAVKALGGGAAKPEQKQQEAEPEQQQQQAPAEDVPAAITSVYFSTNWGRAGDKVTVGVLAKGSEGQSFSVALFQDGKALIDNAGKITIQGGKGTVTVQLPAPLPKGAEIEARVNGNGISARTTSNFRIDAPSIAVVKGEDIYIDPPVRNLPQWDARWGQTRIAGPKTGAMIDWTENGCNASTAAMILRWFAEDCKLGKIPFPTKEKGKVDKGWYGPRMGEAFWRQADPPGKVELTTSGHIHHKKIYGIASHYLKTAGEIERNESDQPLDKYQAHAVTSEPKGGWLEEIKKLLKTGPVIVGIGDPAATGHFVVAHGVVGGALLVVDPGNILYQAKHWKGAKLISDWSGRDGFADAGEDAAKVRMPPASQWPGAKVPGQEGDKRSYNVISGQFLKELLSKLISLTSLTHSEGAKLDGNLAKQQPAPADAGGAEDVAPQQQNKPQEQKKPEEQKKDDKPASKGKVKSGGITVAGKPFADWFNKEFHPKHTGKHPSIKVKGKNLEEFPHTITAANFKAFFDATKQLAGEDEISLLKFCAAFCLPYNETGGSFHPTIEKGGKVWLPRGEKAKDNKNLIDFGEVGYFFWGIPGYKSSYNKRDGSWTWPAGDELKKQGLLTDAKQIEIWNGSPMWTLGDPIKDPNYPKPLEDPRYPNPQSEPLKTAQKNCHFYKFRGRGFTQTTGREGYIKYAEPALVAAGYGKVDKLTNDELDKAFADPKVYVAVFHNELIVPPGPHKEDFAKIDDDKGKLKIIGDRLAGVGANYGEFYAWRCTTLADAMEAAGWTGG